MPLAAYGYPHPAHSTAGSGVKVSHPAPPVLPDGLHCYPPAPYPCTYNPHYINHAAPPNRYPYADPHLPCYSHRQGALHPPIPPAQYPHYHYCPGAPYCSLTPDHGVPSVPAPATEDDFRADARSALFQPAYSTAYQLPQIFYPQMFDIPFKRRSFDPEAPTPSSQADRATQAESAGKGYVPSHSLVPCNDKLLGVKPGKIFDGAPRWRGFPVMWNGGAPFALVPLSNIDGEQNLFIPKSMPTAFASDHQQKSANADGDSTLRPRSVLPVMWKQGSIPAAIQENGKVNPVVKDSRNDEVSSSRLMPVVGDGKVPIVVMPATKEARKESGSSLPYVVMPASNGAGKDSGSSVPYVLMPASNEAGKDSGSYVPYMLMPTVREAGQELGNLPFAGLKPADKDVGEDCSESSNMASTASSEQDRNSKKEKAFTTIAEGPVKVIPVVQLPSDASPMQLGVAVQKDPPAKVISKAEVSVSADGTAGVDHTPIEPQAVKYNGETPFDAQGAKHVIKESKKDSPMQKKSFPAIKLVPPSDVKRGKSPLKSTATQKKPAGQEGLETMSARSSGSTKASKDEKDSGSKPVISCMSVDGKVSDKAALVNGDCQSTRDVKVIPVCSPRDEKQKLNNVNVVANALPKVADKNPTSDNKVASDVSVEADGCTDKEEQEVPTSTLEKMHVKVIPQESAAVRIQAVYRGYCVRRLKPLTQLRIIKEVQAQMPALLKQVDSNAEMLLEPMERRKLSESIMSLLLKLDSVQGRVTYVRERRKSVAKELSIALEKLDSIFDERLSPTDQLCVLDAVTNGELGGSLQSPKEQEIEVDVIADAVKEASTAPTPGIGIVKGEGLDPSESRKALSGSIGGSLANKGIAVDVEVGKPNFQFLLSGSEGEDKKLEVANERLGAFHCCGNNSDDRGSEELREDADRQEHAVAALPDAAQKQEVVAVGSELAVVPDENGDVTMGLLQDTVMRQQPDEQVETGEAERSLPHANGDVMMGLLQDTVMGQQSDEQVDAGEVEKSLPTEALVREEREVYAQLESNDRPGEKPEDKITPSNDLKVDDPALPTSSSDTMVAEEKIGEQVNLEHAESGSLSKKMVEEESSEELKEADLAVPLSSLNPMLEEDKIEKKVESLPSEALVREEREVYAQPESNDRPGEEPEDMITPSDDSKVDDPAVPTSSSDTMVADETVGEQVSLEHVESESLTKKVVREESSELKDDDPAVPLSSSNAMVGEDEIEDQVDLELVVKEEKIGKHVDLEHIDSEMVYDSTNLGQSQHLHSTNGVYSMKEMEVVRLPEVATETCTDHSGSGIKLSESLREGGVSNAGLEPVSDDICAFTTLQHTESGGEQKIVRQAELEPVESEMAYDSANFACPQHFDSTVGVLSMEEMEDVRCSPEVAIETHTDDTGLGSDSLESLSAEEQQLPEGVVTNVGLDSESDDTCSPTTLLVDETRVKHMPSSSCAMEAGTNMGAEYIMVPEISLTELHETCFSEPDVALERQHDLADADLVQEEESSLSSETADKKMEDNERSLVCESTEFSYLHEDHEVDHQLCCGFAIHEAEGMKARKVFVADICGHGAKPLSHDNLVTPGLTDPGTRFTEPYPIHEENEHVPAVRNLDGNLNKTMSSVQDFVVLAHGQETEDTGGEHSMVGVGSMLKESQYFAKPDESLLNKPVLGLPGSEANATGNCQCAPLLEVQQCEEPELCVSVNIEDPCVDGICDVDNENGNDHPESHECLLPEDIQWGKFAVAGHSNDMDDSQKQVSGGAKEIDLQRHCFENLSAESKSLLAVVEKLAEWNQQAANMIAQLSERMDRLEKGNNSRKHTVNSRKGSRSGRRRRRLALQ